MKIIEMGNRLRINALNTPSEWKLAKIIDDIISGKAKIDKTNREIHYYDSEEYACPSKSYKLRHISEYKLTGQNSNYVQYNLLELDL